MSADFGPDADGGTCDHRAPHPDDFDQGRGDHTSQIASGLDWLLAILIGTFLAMALVSWSEEASPAFTAEVAK